MTEIDKSYLSFFFWYILPALYSARIVNKVLMMKKQVIKFQNNNKDTIRYYELIEKYKVFICVFPVVNWIIPVLDVVKIFLKRR